MGQHRHAEIAGAGFAGLTIATALAQRGWTVRVHERAPEVRAFGAGIWIWENGIRVLSAIGAADDAVARCTAPPEFRNWDHTGRYIHRTTFAPLDSQTGTRVFCSTRQQLLMALLGAATRAGVEVVTGSHVVAAGADGVLRTEDGKSYKADLVIGADGVNSKVRDSLGLLKSRRRHVDGAIRVLVDHEPGFAQSEEGRTIRSWWSGRRRLLYTPCNDDVFYLCFTAPVTDRAGSQTPLNKQEWKRSFPGLASMIDRVGEESRYDAFETVTLSRWSSGRVVIVGDAAHSMPPGLGQGCGMGLVNALSLATMIEEAGDGESTFRRWEQVCRPMTEHTQRWSAVSWPMSRWPMWAIHAFYHAPGWKQWVAHQRWRPSRSIAYRTDHLPRWMPASYG